MDPGRSSSSSSARGTTLAPTAQMYLFFSYCSGDAACCGWAHQQAGAPTHGGFIWVLVIVKASRLRPAPPCGAALRVASGARASPVPVRPLLRPRAATSVGSCWGPSSTFRRCGRSRYPALPVLWPRRPAGDWSHPWDQSPARLPELGPQPSSALVASDGRLSAGPLGRSAGRHAAGGGPSGAHPHLEMRGISRRRPPLAVPFSRAKGSERNRNPRSQAPLAEGPLGSWSFRLQFLSARLWPLGVVIIYF